MYTYGGEYMFLNCILIALSVSIDSLGIGITYGIKGTKINITSKIILFYTSLIIVTFATKLGNLITSIFSNFIANLIGSTMLIFMGFWVIFQSFNKKIIVYKKYKSKIYNFFIKSFRIAIQIIKKPIYSDLDNSKIIDSKEALYLGLALSVDSLCVGISSSMIELNSNLFPILVSTFQLLFISFGNLLGKKLKNSLKFPENIYSILSGILLILIGLFKFL